MKIAPIFLPLFALAAVLPQVQAEPARVTILKSDGKRLIGYIQNTNDKGIQFSYNETDPNPIGVPHTDIQAVSFDEESDIIGPARYAYTRQQFEQAEELFEKVANDYGYLWGIKREQLGNFASDARFYQIDCLRRMGDYSQIGAALATPTGKTLEDTVDETLVPTVKLFRMWESTAAKDWAKVEAGMKEYEQPLSGKKAELFKVPSFRDDLSPNTVAQLSYMRGLMYQAQDRKTDALNDFYRAATLDYGSERELTKEAMEHAIEIQAASETLKDSYVQKKDLRALAVIYRDAYNKGEIKSTWDEFTDEPEMPEAMKKQMEDAEKASGEASE